MHASLRRFVIVAVSAVAVTMSVSSSQLVGQEPKTTPSDAPKTTSSDIKTKAGVATRRPYDRSRRVPPYFAQIGISDDQREAIYKIQSKHAPRLEALEKQLADARAESLAECEAILTAPEKQALEQKREAGVRNNQPNQTLSAIDSVARARQMPEPGTRELEPPK